MKSIFQPVYSKLKGIDVHEFVCSIDGINVQPNISRMPTGEKDWPHCDQTERADIFKCVQGQVVLTNTNASFRATPKSHKHFVDMMKIAEAVGHPYNKVAKWFNHTRGKDKSQGTGKLSSLRKCPDCDEIISKFNGRHKLTCAGRKDFRKEEHEVKNDDVVVKMRQEKVSKGQGDMSNLDNQPGEDVASQSELDDSYSSLRALLDPDPDSDLMNLTWT